MERRRPGKRTEQIDHKEHWKKRSLVTQLALTDGKKVAEGTMAFWFKPEKPLKFTAGQIGDFMLENPPRTDDKGNTR